MVCPKDEEICNPDATVEVPPGSIVACKNLKETAELRDSSAEQCIRFKERENVEHVCGCADTCPTQKPTPHPSEFRKTCCWPSMSIILITHFIPFCLFSAHPPPSKEPTRHPTPYPTDHQTPYPSKIHKAYPALFIVALLLTFAFLPLLTSAHPPAVPNTCMVCPKDEEICNPDSTVNVPPGSVVACKNLKETAEMRDLTAEQCNRFKERENVEHVCGCADTCTMPTKEPTPYPSEHWNLLSQFESKRSTPTHT